VFAFITHEAAGASTPGIPHALVFSGGDRFTHTPGEIPPRECGVVFEIVWLFEILAE